MFDVEKFIALVAERPALYDPRVPEYSSREIKSRCWWEIGAEVCANWDELNSREQCEKEKELMRKWKAVRDNFVKDIRHRKKWENGDGLPKRRRYIYYSAMQFLLPIIDNSEEGGKASETDTPVVSSHEHRSSPRHTRHKSSGRLVCRIKAPPSITTTNGEDGSNSHNIKEEPAMTSMTMTTTATTTMPTPSLTPSPIPKNLANVFPQMHALQSEKTKDTFGNRAFLQSFVPIMDELPSDLALDARLKITEVFKNVCATHATRKSVNSDSELILPERLVELVDSASDDVSLDVDLSN